MGDVMKKKPCPKIVFYPAPYKNAEVKKEILKLIKEISDLKNQP